MAAGRTVLLSAYTNAALDNLVRRLAACGEAVLRLGHASSAHPAVAHLTLDALAARCSSPIEIRRAVRLRPQPLPASPGLLDERMSRCASPI